VLTIILVFTNIAGIGGGILTVPIIMGMYAFDTKPAVAISGVSIFVASLTSYVLHFNSKHPEKPNVTQIDYHMVTIMMPVVLAGS
jgi:uncharacterized membrane protein YfcA